MPSSLCTASRGSCRQQNSLASSVLYYLKKPGPSLRVRQGKQGPLAEPGASESAELTAAAASVPRLQLIRQNGVCSSLVLLPLLLVRHACRHAWHAACMRHGLRRRRSRDGRRFRSRSQTFKIHLIDIAAGTGTRVRLAYPVNILIDVLGTTRTVVKSLQARKLRTVTGAASVLPPATAR